jgi:hypothetical protein
MAIVKSNRPGRPKTAVAAERKDVREFFNACDRLGLSLAEIQQTLVKHVQHAPSYRTLQEWRRGTHAPKFAPFGQWLELLGSEKSTQKRA